MGTVMLCTPTIIDLGTYLVINEGNTTPATEYVKNTINDPLIKSPSLAADGKDFKTWRNA